MEHIKPVRRRSRTDTKVARRTESHALAATDAQSKGVHSGAVHEYASRGAGDSRDVDGADAESGEVRDCRDDIGAVADKAHLGSGGDGYASLTRDLDGHRSGRVVEDEVEFLVGRDDEFSIPTTASPGQLDVHVPGNARGTVRDGDGRGSTRRDRLGHIARDCLLDENTEVVVRGVAPRACLVVVSNQFQSKVGAVSRRHV